MEQEEKKLSDELEDAAEKYLDGIFGKGKHVDFYIQLFKAGAEWQANQGASYETIISADKTVPVLPMKDVSEMGFDYGDKVVVQIKKK